MGHFYTFHGYANCVYDQTLPSTGCLERELTTYSAEVIQHWFTAVQNYNLWPQAFSYTQSPWSGIWVILIGKPVILPYHSKADFYRPWFTTDVCPGRSKRLLLSNPRVHHFQNAVFRTNRACRYELTEMSVIWPHPATSPVANLAK